MNYYKTKIFLSFVLFILFYIKFNLNDSKLSKYVVLSKKLRPYTSCSLIYNSLSELADLIESNKLKFFHESKSFKIQINERLELVLLLFNKTLNRYYRKFFFPSFLILMLEIVKNELSLFEKSLEQIKILKNKFKSKSKILKKNIMESLVNETKKVIR
jgi:hypothetical protein